MLKKNIKKIIFLSFVLLPLHDASAGKFTNLFINFVKVFEKIEDKLR